MAATDLRVGGIASMSSCDWPGELVATFFCQGCSWDCPYCHNQSLRPATGKAETQIPWDDLVAFLKQRGRLLDGVVFSGGEPTLQSALPDAMRGVRDLGFKIGLHTAGVKPERLIPLLPLVDWIGFDIKGPFSLYDKITRIPNSAENVKKSLQHLLESGVSHQIRTTVYPPLLDEAALLEMKADLAAFGITDYTLQPYQERPLV
ncbi:MAG: anaerobic ribonucleoside-triphosphate reductase activating protein [Zymomonas mobilis subsp. pomaceae]|uniref:Anaerobic ribonucleoside-triphosphate reductase activating protein n=1 Tax=Zymomonas mobilis subsp. pomaceae (strain ATCC 29192 / DSM 22645 / JCM 10191 / CCUG 17912 / NBRC 13757 / NCIMB 11200 / NRRL B-4491 / Barker I) TaxID=579138 RepID=F8EU75_ZYMMT|nr:anaerobic ribonucleoside-triphosphate reductase activating protein [Zymomonas mobilis]AEI37155.1 anaerobic ribonucleoside-triphosphate reductase activating protein [Zymomonas mobilis subsp. pomaceae ATCC 29192]MDX5948525.1 anaerobic ribonucleoside-triphosphate reductase activating protein [Zymomonas mobilis subsp. pomaceae]GEB89833.1 anaerobic ribonucleoside-triphosphate reductase activating protein [Zymomonas mobilis subsp. pomaceae]